VIREIHRQPDMQVVGQVTDALEVLMAVREARVDAVVLALEGDEIPGLSSHLLAEFSGLTVLGLGTGDRLAVLEQLCPSRHRIERSDARKVVRRLRHAIRQPCTPLPRLATDDEVADARGSSRQGGRNGARPVATEEPRR